MFHRVSRCQRTNHFFQCQQRCIDVRTFQTRRLVGIVGVSTSLATCEIYETESAYFEIETNNVSNLIFPNIDSILDLVPRTVLHVGIAADFLDQFDL
jgi:hypothetical protein